MKVSVHCIVYYCAILFYVSYIVYSDELNGFVNMLLFFWKCITKVVALSYFNNNNTSNIIHQRQ